MQLTRQMADLYLRPMCTRMWNTCLEPEKPQVQLNFGPVKEKEQEEACQQFELIVNKAIQIDSTYRVGHLEHLRDFNMNDYLPLLMCVLQGVHTFFRTMSSADPEQINRVMLSIFLHILAAMGHALPHQLIPQVDHLSISVI